MNILIIRLSSLGDVVLSSIVARSIKQNMPNSHIVLVTKDKFSEVIKICPYFNKVLPLKAPYGIKELKELIANINKSSWDLIIDLHNNPRSILISKMSKAKAIIRYHKRITKRRFLVAKSRLKAIAVSPLKNHRVEVLDAVDLKNSWHVVDGYMDTLKELDIKPIRATPFLEVKEKETDVLTIGFHPGGKWHTKQWQVENYIKLGKALIRKYNEASAELSSRGNEASAELSSRGNEASAELSSKDKARILIFGDKEDQKIANQIEKALNGVNLAGKTSISELAYYIKQCDLLICNDSGPMHIAVGLGVPVIALFGPTVPEFGFFPFGKSDKIISVDLPCRPCSLHGTDFCPIGTHACMCSISAEFVFKIAMEIIQGKH